MKLITTSAQKTTSLSRQAVLAELIRAVSKRENISFKPTANPHIYRADYKDGSKLLVAAFDKSNGSSLAMIDHQNVPASSRQQWHAHWRKTIDDLFA